MTEPTNPRSSPASQRVSSPQDAPLVVGKVGGSLFRDSSFATRLLQWWSDHRPLRLALIAGGGPLADVVRDWDQRFALPTECGHELAMQTMQVTSGFVFSQLNQAAAASAKSKLPQDELPAIEFQRVESHDQLTPSRCCSLLLGLFWNHDDDGLCRFCWACVGLHQSTSQARVRQMQSQLFQVFLHPVRHV